MSIAGRERSFCITSHWRCESASRRDVRCAAHARCAAHSRRLKDRRHLRALGFLRRTDSGEEVDVIDASGTDATNGTPVARRVTGPRS